MRTSEQARTGQRREDGPGYSAEPRGGIGYRDSMLPEKR